MRGRIIERLRDLDDGTWETLPASIGDHDTDAIEAVALALEREGMVERRPDGAVRLPSG